LKRKNPILENVRRARDKFAAACDRDIHRISERMREITKQWKGKVVGEEEEVLGKGRAAARSRQGTRT